MQSRPHCRGELFRRTLRKVGQRDYYRGSGLAFVDDGSAARRGGGLQRATAERVIDDKLSAAAIDGQLAALESGALQRGQALGSGFAYPVTLEKVAQWANAVEQRGYQLAPASALTAKR